MKGSAQSYLFPICREEHEQHLSMAQKLFYSTKARICKFGMFSCMMDPVQAKHAHRIWLIGPSPTTQTPVCTWVDICKSINALGSRRSSCSFCVLCRQAAGPARPQRLGQRAATKAQEAGHNLAAIQLEHVATGQRTGAAQSHLQHLRRATQCPWHAPIIIPHTQHQPCMTSA